MYIYFVNKFPVLNLHDVSSFFSYTVDTLQHQHASGVMFLAYR